MMSAIPVDTPTGYRGVPVSVVALDEFHDSRVPAGNGDQNADIEDERRGNRPAFRGHLYLCEAGRSAI